LIPKDLVAASTDGAIVWFVLTGVVSLIRRVRGRS
jgi:hypothetical protein